MLNVALAVLSSLIWGVGDYAGGKATQHAAALAVVWLSKLVSLPLLAVYLVATYVPITPIGLAWGGLAGVAGVVGLVLFYRALSAGAMTVVAPITGVTSAAIPVVVGLLSGERPSASRLLGVGCALLAIAMVSLAPQPPRQRQLASSRLVIAALGAGAGFALFFILIALAGEAASGATTLRSPLRLATRNSAFAVMSQGPATIVNRKATARGQGPGRIMRSSRPQMMSALNCEPAIGQRPAEPLVA